MPDLPPASEKKGDGTKTTTPATPRSTPSLGSYGGYSSPIVTLEEIEVPLADGSSVVLPFLDVGANSYYTGPVAWAYKNEITGGMNADNTRFDPLATCTRAQMVTFLWRAAGKPEPAGAGGTFPDVAAGSYYEKAVRWAVENGVTNGEYGKFKPNAPVTRASAVTFLYRASGKPAATAAETFPDVAANAYYTDAVQWAAANGITLGEYGKFKPDVDVNRAMSVTFLYRAYKDA